MQLRGLFLWAALASLAVPVFAWERIRGESRSEPVLRVLTVGVGRYRDLRGLNYAVRDARAVARAFQDHSAGLFARVDTQLLTDDQADRRGMLAALQNLQHDATTQDVTVIYYTGHAGNDAPIGFYLAPGRYRDRLWRQTMLKGSELKRAWEAIPGRVIVLLDTCYTGALWDADESTGKHNETHHLEAVLTATRTAEGTRGNRFWPGDFTQVLLEGLAGAGDSDGDGRVTLGEMASYLERRVSERRGDEQHAITVVPSRLRELPLAQP